MREVMHDPSLIDRAFKEERERRELAPWAMHSADSRGRRYPEPADPLRTVFERDRDRIVHSVAFRRLMYKTQVFINSRGDHNRTRLSHSLEVAQVARSVGSALRLNETLCETLALAHDLGHPPFGHRGEWALNERMRGRGGFRHNAQVLRVVDELERRHPDFPGLNLTRETRESLLKHEGEETWPEEFHPRPQRPLLEAQVVDLADSTAYQKHDVEDGIDAGMFTEEEIADEVALWRHARDRVMERHPGFLEATRDRRLRVHRVTTELIGRTIDDLIRTSHRRIRAAELASRADVQAHPTSLVGHSDELAPEVAELSLFLYRHFYRHEHLQRFREHARRLIFDLFDAYVERPAELSDWYRNWADEVGLERAVCDFVAGMTDRFAEEEYRRLVGGPTISEALAEGG